MATRLHSTSNSMKKRGYLLLTTPIDAGLSSEALVRNYELVRRNISEIAPFLPENAEVDIMAGGTPHNAQKIPLLGLHLPDWDDSDATLAARMQDAIDAWYRAQEADKLNEAINAIRVPTWEHLLTVGAFPDRSGT